MTDKQYGDFQRIIGRLEGLAEGLDLDNEPLKEFLTGTTDALIELVNELRHPRMELKLKTGGNYDVKVDDDRPHSYL